MVWATQSSRYFWVATWCLDKFSSKDNLKKITANLWLNFHACACLCNLYNRGTLMIEGSWQFRSGTVTG